MLNLSNVYPNAATKNQFFNMTQLRLQNIREDHKNIVTNVENDDSLDLCNPLYEITQDFFYNDTKTWLVNVSYSEALKLVFLAK